MNKPGLRAVALGVGFTVLGIPFGSGCGGHEHSSGIGGIPGYGLNAAGPVSGGGGRIALIDPARNAVADVISVGATPRSPVALPNLHAVYVPDSGEDPVSVLDANFDRIVEGVTNDSAMSGGRGADSGAALPGSDLAYFGNAGDNTLSAVDTTIDDIGRPGNGKVLKRISLPGRPVDVAVNSHGTRVYALTVDSAGVGQIAVVDPLARPVADQEVRETFALPPSAEFGSLAVGPALDYLYYTSQGGLNIVDIAPGSPTKNQVVATVPVGDGPGETAVSFGGTRLFVLSRRAGQMTVLDTDPASPHRHSILATIPVGPSPRWIAVSDITTIYIADDETNSVTVLREGSPGSFTVTGTIPLPGKPSGLSVHPTGRVVYACLEPAAAPHPVVTFADGTFRDQNWTAIKLADNTAGAAALGRGDFTATGGHSGAFRKITHTWTGGDRVSRGLTIAHMRFGAKYSPSAQGAIESVDWAYDHILTSQQGGTPGVAIYPVIRQNGIYYSHYAVTVEQNWTRTSFTRLGAADFPGGAGAPDFSATAAPLEFGYATANATDSSHPVTTVSGVDNWTVTIYPAGSRARPERKK